MKIFVAGHRGMVGSAICRAIKRDMPQAELLLADRQSLDLLDQAAVFGFLDKHRPDYIFIAAARVGGIHANNTLRGQFLFENLAIETNLIHGAYKAGVKSLMFLGSSCIYPRDCPQPIKEEYLLTGPLEPTNEPYALAKIAGLKLCEAYNQQYGTNYICLMPTNLYGPNDNYDLETSHVLPALIRKAYEAKQAGHMHLDIWGSGRPRREFLYVDDLADACLHFMALSLKGFFGDAPNSGLRAGLPLPIINIGTGEDQTIEELAQMVCSVVGLEAELRFDTTKPEGTPVKRLDVSRARGLGWSARTNLKCGVTSSFFAYVSFLSVEGSRVLHP